MGLILKMKRLHFKRFRGSTLEKMIKRLANEDLSGHEEEK